MKFRQEIDSIAIRESFKTTQGGRLFTSEMVDDLFESGDIRTFPAESMIFLEGDTASGIFLVLRGVVKLARYTFDGREVILHLAEANRFIAEAAIFLGKYPATAVATEDTVLLLIKKETVLDLMDRYPAFNRRIFNAMANWLKRMVDKIDQLTLNDASARLATWLLQECGQCPECSDGSVITIPVKKGDLATLLNMNQATLSRALRKLKTEEIIEIRGREITLNSLPALKKASLPPIE